MTQIARTRLRAMAHDTMTKWWLTALAIGLEQLISTWWRSWWNLTPFVAALGLVLGYRLLQVRRYNEQQALQAEERSGWDSNPRGQLPGPPP
jgi:hypothetical protein